MFAVERNLFLFFTTFVISISLSFYFTKYWDHSSSVFHDDATGLAKNIHIGVAENNDPSHIRDRNQKSNRYLSVFMSKNGQQIWTADEQNPYAEAFVLDTHSGEFAAVGSREDVEKFLSIDKRYEQHANLIDSNENTLLTDAMITPGFIDSHLHLLVGGASMMGVRLRDAKSPTDFTRIVSKYIKDHSPSEVRRPNSKKFILEKGDWILGGEWTENNWGGELPRKEWIDDITPHHPVYLLRMDAHSCLCNSLALKLANITKHSPDIEGGTIVKDELTGEPTGVLKDLAMNLVQQIIPPVNQTSAFLVALDEAAKNGVTFVHDMGAGPFAEQGASWKQLRFYREMHREGKLTVRISQSLELTTWEAASEYVKQNGNGDDWVMVGPLKAFFDGSLGSHTALQFEPYAEDETNYGLQVISDEELHDGIANAEQEDLQVAIHAIGEKAIHHLIDIFEDVIRNSKNPKRDRRFRIEHVQQILPSDIERMKKLNLIASVQPSHLLDDAKFAERVLGRNKDKLQNLYVFRSLLDHNITTSLGSDWFVADINPMLGIYAATTRITENEPSGWFPKQRISVEESLRGYTTGGAYAAFKEHRIGKIKAGYLADFVLLDRNLFKIDSKDIKDAKVLLTVVGAKIVYADDHFSELLAQ